MGQGTYVTTFTKSERIGLVIAYIAGWVFAVWGDSNGVEGVNPGDLLIIG